MTGWQARGARHRAGGAGAGERRRLGAAYSAAASIASALSSFAPFSALPR
jgi:hypothetical protein